MIGDGGKRERVAQLGAQVVIDYCTEDFAKVIAKATDGRGVDMVVEFGSVRAAYADLSD